VLIDGVQVGDPPDGSGAVGTRPGFASRVRRLALGFFFVSGLCGLIYEVVWIRAAGTVIGNTTYAIGTVVGVYMTGLALGGFWGGRAADRRSGARLLGLYGRLEAGVALSALAVPLLLAASQPLFRMLWRAVGDSPAVYPALRVLLIGAVLIVPTTCMGATLPVLSRFLAESGRNPAREAGRAYAANTFGGVAGIAVAGFWAVPSLGLRATLGMGVVLTALIAAGSLALARAGDGGRRPHPAAADRPATLALSVAAVSGCAALICEVAWTRSIVLAIGSTVYAFSLVLAAFILGLAAGSALSARLLAARDRPVVWLAAIQLAIGTLTVALLPFLGDLPIRIAPLIASYGSDFSRLLLVEFGWTSLIVFLPAVAMGMVFPVACRLAVGSRDALGRSVGAVYGWNTIGSIVGTLAATFALVPWIGLSSTIRCAALLNFALAAVLSWLASPAWRRAAVIPAVAAALSWVVPEWNPQVMASGVFLYGAQATRAAAMNRTDLVRQLESETEIVARHQDSYGLVTVHRDGEGVLSLRINGKVDASDGREDMLTQLMVGHLPALHHAAPRRGLVIGLGGGVTLAAVARHPFDALDCIEISSAVVRASRHFRRANRGVLDDPRVRLVVGDGRAAVAFSPQLYDVIVAEPSNLWLSGMASLYTREFYAQAAARLAPGGRFTQWVHAYKLPVDDFLAVVRTFYAVFPHGSVWEVFPGTDYILLGALDPVRPEIGQLDDRLTRRGVAEDLSDAGPSGMVQLLGHLVTDAEGARRMAGTGPLVTDDHAAVEYTAPRGLYGEDSRPELLSVLDTVRRRPVARRLYAGVDEELDARIADRRAGRADVAAAFRLYTQLDAPGALARLDSIRARHGLDRQTRRFFDGIAQQVRFDARRLSDAGRHEQAVRLFLSVPRDSAEFAEARLDLAYVARAAGRAKLAEAAQRAASGEGEAAVAAAIELSRALEQGGRLDHAALAWRDVVRLRPRSVEARLRLATCLLRTGQTEEARLHGLEALALDPDSHDARQLLAGTEPPR